MAAMEIAEGSWNQYINDAPSLKYTAMETAAEGSWNQNINDVEQEVKHMRFVVYSGASLWGISWDWYFF